MKNKIQEDLFDDFVNKDLGGFDRIKATGSIDEFYNYVKGLLEAGAIDDYDYYSSLSEDEKEDLIRNTWMKDSEIIDDFILNNLTESIDSQLLTVNNIEDYITLDNSREQWDYPIEDIDEANANNDFLVLNKKDNRIYEVTEEEYQNIKAKLLKTEAKKYDTLAFAQLLPMSFTDFIDSHIYDFIEEWEDNEEGTEKEAIEAIIEEYTDDLDDEESEEFDNKLAKQYIQYMLEKRPEKTPIVLEFWETESDRDNGLGEVYKNYKIEDKDKAIKDAKHLINLMSYASVEVWNEDTDESYYWSDGVDEDYFNKKEENKKDDIKNIQSEIDKKVKQYKSAQKQYNGDSNKSARLEDEIEDLENKIKKLKKEEKKTLDQEIEEIEKVKPIDENTKSHLKQLETDLLNIDGVTEVEFDLHPYLDNNSHTITLVSYNIDSNNTLDWYNKKKKQFKDIVDTFKENGVTIEKEEIEDNDTYYYFVSYSNNWNKKEESKQLEKPINFEFGRIKGIIEPNGDITYNKGYSKNNTSIKFNYYDEEVTPFAHTDKQKIVNYISKNILK